MSVVIRPALGVFRHAMPLVVLFGAYRRAGFDPALPAGAAEDLAALVERSRALRAPLAFCRPAPRVGGATPPAGVWLPGCRPRVTDRLFEHPEGPAFTSEAFEGTFRSITEREIVLAGPDDDSSLLATAAAARPMGRTVTLVTPSGPMQKRSTDTEDWPDALHRLLKRGRYRELAIQDWQRRLLDVRLSA